jgi:hypothetical protein
MRKMCTRTLSLLTEIVFIGLSSSVAAEGSTYTEISRRVDVRIDGGFEFRDVTTGDYAPRVTDRLSLAERQQFVTIQDHMPELEVRLPERESDRGGARSGTASVTELMHPLKAEARSRCAAPNLGRRHRHVPLPKLWVRHAESKRWDNQRRFNSLHSLVTPQRMANGMRILVRYPDADQYRYS